MINLKKVL